MSTHDNAAPPDGWQPEPRPIPESLRRGLDQAAAGDVRRRDDLLACPCETCDVCDNAAREPEGFGTYPHRANIISVTPADFAWLMSDDD